MMSGRPTDLIQSVSRALRILEEVGDSPEGLNAKQIAHRCDIALPTTYHLEDLVVGFDEGAHATALGKALLSTITVGQRKALLEEQGLRPFTSNTITDEGQLHHEIALSARSGIFTEEQQYRPEVCCAAVLVGGRQGAIGMSGGSERWAQLSRALVAQLATHATDLKGAGAVELA